MIRITRPHTSQKADEVDAAHHYRIAGQALVFQSQVDSLEAFLQGKASDQYNQFFLTGKNPQILYSENALLKYNGVAQFDRAQRQVDFWRKKDFAQIDIDGEPVCHIDLSNESIHLLNHASFDDRLNLEAVTGPALVILLAQKNVWCLHAGAVRTAQGNIVIVGESGAGKSTLSAHVGDGWSQISDDILPIMLAKDQQSVELRQDYPQLKLDGAKVAQAPRNGATIDYVIRINPVESEQIEFKRLGRTDGLLQLVRHTVAARLFDEGVMRAHARFVKAMSGLVPVIEVSYPRDHDGLSALRESIIAHLATL